MECILEFSFNYGDAHSDEQGALDTGNNKVIDQHSTHSQCL